MSTGFRLKRFIAAVGGAVCWLSAAGCPTASDVTGLTNSPTTALTPARSLVGTWRTAIAFPVTIQTDACGSRQEVGRANWMVTWNVRDVAGFTNVIDVDMSVSYSGLTPVGSCGLAGWVPFPPQTIRLCVSSSQITGCTGTNYKNGQAFGPFTSNLMSLTWTHWECIVVCYGEVSATNEMKLVKS
ncbi:MAG: hypothetical protein P3A28_07305 [Gemmatimonadota bacterium]|nr:hypothetical protein [Gemmatimonadota bacterium]